MYNPALLVPIYLDDDLVKTLSSLIIDGYFEKKTVRCNFEGSLGETKAHNLKEQEQKTITTKTTEKETGEESQSIGFSPANLIIPFNLSKKTSSDTSLLPNFNGETPQLSIKDLQLPTITPISETTSSYSIAQDLTTTSSESLGVSISSFKFLDLGVCNNLTNPSKKTCIPINKYDNNYKSTTENSKEKTKDTQHQNVEECNVSNTINGKGFNEFSVDKVYSNYYFHNQVIGQLYSNNMIKYVDCNNLSNLKTINYGDIVELNVQITSTSLTYYINNLLKLLSGYGTSTLDKLLEGKNLGLLNYTVMFNILTSLKEILLQYETEDIVVETPFCKFVLPLHLNYLVKKGGIYDYLNCPCKIIGKVSNIVDSTKSISLIRKTTDTVYYTEFFQSLQPYLHILKQNSIVLPGNFSLFVNGFAMEVLPISIQI